jgi:LPS-assembly lipoprotein
MTVRGAGAAGVDGSSRLPVVRSPLARAGPLGETARMIRRLLPAVLVLALAGCGFHLRNALLLPADLGPVRVVAPSARSELAQDLSEALTRAGAQLADGKAGAPVARLDIVSERWGNLPISVDQRGRAQEYNLRYAVIFRLRRADGSDLVPQQALELSRDYIAGPALASGTEGEREILVRELRREMAASILRRIDAVSRLAQEQPQPAVPTDGTTTP